MRAGRAARLRAVAPAVVVVALVLVAMRAVLPHPLVRSWGAGTDALHQVWGLWWLLAARGPGHSTLVSFPAGEWGSVSPPVEALAVLPIVPILGPVAAYNMLCAGILILDLAAVGACASVLVGSRRAGWIAALALLCARPLLAHVGFGTPEGMAVAGLPLLVVAGLRWGSPGERWWTGPAVGLLAGLSVVENAYTLPLVAPLFAGLAVRRLRRPGGLGQVTSAAILVLGVAGLGRLWMGPGPGAFFRDARTLSWAGRALPIYDWDYQTAVRDLVLPWPRPRFSDPPIAAMQQGGLTFLGWVPLALALLGGLRGGRVGRISLAVAVGCGMLALGSAPLGDPGPPGPFWLLNVILEQVYLPLTQPVRFTVMAALALAVAAASGAEALRAALPAAWSGRVITGLGAALVLEAGLAGGPSISIPAGAPVLGRCFRDLAPGPVWTVVPGAAARDAREGQIRLDAALRLQLGHRHAGTHRGLSAWARDDDAMALEGSLSALGAALGSVEPPETAASGVAELVARGVRWVLVPEGAALPWMGPPVARCDGWMALDLASIGSALVATSP